MKVGIIRCMQTEDFCPGTTDFRMIREKKGAFEGVERKILRSSGLSIAEVVPEKRPY